MSGTTVPARVADDEAHSASEVAGAVQPAASSPVPPVFSVGQQLSAARLARGLTADDVAKALKLSLRQVVALEADDWSSLPCKTIIRGFVRNYARLLGLNPDLLMAALDQLVMPQAPELKMSVGTPVNMPQEGKVERRDFVRVLSGLVVLLLAVAAYFFFPQELWLSTLSALKSATQSVEVAVDNKEKAVEPEATKTPAIANRPEAAITTAAGSGQAADTAAAAPVVLPNVSASPASASTSATVLKFSFTEQSWVEVRDRSGQVIFSKRNEAGSTREVEGVPPFALVIGNSAAVTLQYKGKVVELANRSKDNVARLTVE